MEKKIGATDSSSQTRESQQIMAMIKRSTTLAKHICNVEALVDHEQNSTVTLIYLQG